MALLEELVEEVLLRLPPADPASLVRAALVCKGWHRTVSNPRFRRPFLEFHRRAPPLLGVLCNLRYRNVRGGGYASRLVPTSAACPAHDAHHGSRALDARHGRVLLGHARSTTAADLDGLVGRHLFVWDPVTYGLCALPPPDLLPCNAAVLCTAGDACDHLECHGGPFIVVALGTGPEAMWLSVFSSDAASWSEPTYVSPVPEHGVAYQPAALVGDTLYFAIDAGRSILRYVLATREASVINQPPESSVGYENVLITMEDGGLGFAELDRAARLSLWSMEASPNGGNIAWTKIRVVELEKLLPADALSVSYKFLRYAHGIGVFFIGADVGLFSIDLKSGLVEKVCEGVSIYSVVPYMSFYTPAELKYVVPGVVPAGVDASSG